MSSPSLPSAPASPLLIRKGPRPSHRTKLRNGTFVIPGTGERVRRRITLLNLFDGPTNDHPSDDDAGSTIVPGRMRHVATTAKNKIEAAWTWLKSPTGRGVLKCSLAYLLGCMGTLSPLEKILGQQDGKHIVATITVYFSPARSAGSMVEGLLLGLGAFIYFLVVSISSMAVAVFCETQLGLIELGYAIVLIVFVGGGLGLVGWAKQAYSHLSCMSVACSLASLTLITILTKENAVQTGVFSDDKIVQVTKMLILGMSLTTAVCLLVWPVSARRELRESMIKTTDSLGDMLTTITRCFLSGQEDLRSESFKKATSDYKKVFTLLTRNLKEAKYEHYLLGTEDEYKLEKGLVNSMQRLEQSIGGLRSAATTQFTLLQEKPTHGSSTPMNALRISVPQLHAISPHLKSRQSFSTLAAIDEAPDESSGSESNSVADISKQTTSSAMPTVRTPCEIFSRFITHLGPSMKSLAYTLSQILEELPFSPGPDFSININENFRTSLTDALQLYSNARAEALKELYKSKELIKERPENVEADFEEVAASCGHFSYSLQDFAREMQIFMEILDDLKHELEQPNRRSWKWLAFWRKDRPQHFANKDPERESLIDQNAENGMPSTPTECDIGRRTAVSQKPEGVSSLQRMCNYLLTIARFLERDDIKFAVKVGVGAALWALIAFIPETRPFYAHWRGEWGLLSFMLVCSMTIGAANTTGWSRFIGTVMGALIAIVSWQICQENPWALGFVGWLISLPCFYIIIAKGQGPFGRFILLTYNLSVLYAYSLSLKEGDHDEDEGGSHPMIFEITLHRASATLVGCVWGLIITRVIFPISARQKFKDGLSLLWLRMGLIWKRDPLSFLLEGDKPNEYMDIGEEFALQRYLSRLDNIRSQALSEMELRGPFPDKEYGRIMDSTRKMLDAFHAMNVVIQKDSKASEGEAAILRYTAEERADLSARISHLFQVLASSMKLEYPLNDALPATAPLRDRLLAKMYHFRKEQASQAATNGNSTPNSNGHGNGSTRSSEAAHEVLKDEDYALLYAFALVTGQLATEIEKVEREVENLFGVMDEHLLELQ